jgi:methyl acetate hydrolase
MPARKRFAVMLGALWLAAPASAQPRLSEAGQRELDAYLTQAVARDGIPGLVAMVVDGDQVLYAGAFGRRDVANNVPMTVDSIFRIASMTKPITSVAVMLLVEAGRVSLDDPIEQYLPEFAGKSVFASFDPVSKRYTERPATGPITVRQLLTHTSGLGYAWSSDILFRLVGAEDASPSAAHLPLLHDPGAHWTYGESTRVLGRLIEVVSGQPFAEFLRERILTPLGMADTDYAVSDAQRPRVVTSHVRGNAGFSEIPNPDGRLAGVPRGDGGLFSTAPNYARFLALILNEGRAADGRTLLRPTTIAEMSASHIGELRVELQTPAHTTRSRPFPLGAGHDGFGLGFQITGPDPAPAGRSPGSLSWAGIQNTQFWIDPARGIGGLLLMQYLPFYDELAIETLQGFEARLYRHLDARP